MELKEIWDKALIDIKDTVNSTVGYNIYIKESTAIDFDGKIFKIAVPMTINKNMIDYRYKNFIEEAISKIVHSPVTLCVIVSENPESLISNNVVVQQQNNNINSKSVNPRYTFDTFVIGSSNEFATAAALSTSQNPGKVYNPLFLYGNSGLGKTHLMHAIGNKILEHSPNLKVVYVSSEQFTNEFILSVRENKMEEFRAIYRKADVLLLDDVQFLAKKEQTQEEFFHTFNELYATNRQIVLTSDRKPKDLITLEDRLRTRFEQGLTIDITIPDYETRVAILQKKALLQNTHISEDVLGYIAERVKSNIRELEGALLKLVSYAEIHDLPINRETTELAIGSILPDDGIVKITSVKIMDKVCVYYNITNEDLIGKAKTKNITIPRQVAMYLCKTLTNMNFVEIAKEFGNRDRTTVMHNVDKIKEELESNESLSADIEYIKKDLQSID